MMNEVSVKIINSVGQTVQSTNYNQVQKIDLKLNDKSGVYFVELNDLNGNTKTFKLVLNY
ncbi:MAG: T9SS type A sorting domain-containing protein [Fluviicola sp.]